MIADALAGGCWLPVGLSCRSALSLTAEVGRLERKIEKAGSKGFYLLNLKYHRKYY